MRALVLEGYHALAVKLRPVPELRDGSVMIGVDYTGICGTDVHGYTGRNGRRVPGQVMGHEIAGTVIELGGSVSPGVLRPGQLITVNPVLSCGQCAACSAGADQRCAAGAVIGVDPKISSGFAEFMAVPTGNVHVLPDGMPAAHGALVEPMAVALHAVRRADVRAGDLVLVLGGGPIGQAVVLAARSAGACQVVVSELDPARRTLCGSLGADVVDAGGNVPAQLLDASGQLADVTIDAVGIAASLRDALAATRPGGTIGLVGMGAQRLELAPYPLTTAEQSIVGCYCYSKVDFADAVSVLSDYPAELTAKLIAADVAMDEAPAMFERLAREGDVAGKVLVRCARPADA